MEEEKVLGQMKEKLTERRRDNKLWLIKYLEKLKAFTQQNLLAVVQREEANVPKIHAEIMIYHKCLSRQLTQIVQEGLQENEFITILAWTLNTYKGPELMGHPDLSKYTQTLSNLLEDSVLEGLKAEYFAKLEKNYSKWLRNVLKTEINKWKSHNEPEREDILRSNSPMIIVEMMKQTLVVAKGISDDITREVVLRSIKYIENYVNTYRQKIKKYKKRKMEKNKLYPFFKEHLIALINDCQQYLNLGKECLDDFLQILTDDRDAELLQKYNKIFLNLRSHMVGYFLENVYKEVEKHCEWWFKPCWVGNRFLIDSCVAAIKWVWEDFQGFTKANVDLILAEAQAFLIHRYMIAMLSENISFKTREECQAVGKQIESEIHKLQNLFVSLHPEKRESSKHFNAIVKMTEILKTDEEMMSLELRLLIDEYPDITKNHLLRLCYMRGDLEMIDMEDKISFFIDHNQLVKNTIFSHLVFPQQQIIKSNIVRKSRTRFASFRRNKFLEMSFLYKYFYVRTVGRVE